MYPQQQGVALVAVLMVLAVSASLSLSIAKLTSRRLASAEAHLHYTALYYAALQAEAFAMATLATSHRQNAVHPLFESSLKPEQTISEGLPPISLAVEIQDMQSLFNLNYLNTANTEADQRARERVFDNYCAELRLPQPTCNEVASFIWTSAPTEHQPNTDQAQYLSVFRLVSTLLANEIIDLKMAATIAGKFVSLPALTPINTSTASARLIKAIAPALGTAKIHNFIARRQSINHEKATHSADEALSLLSLGPLPLSDSSLFYRIDTFAKLGDRERRLTSVVAINPDNSEVNLVYRKNSEFLSKGKQSLNP